ncbi:maleylpyruvate isomerase family mycothiol-dependent enzyme [Winogradskya humida]|uniref:Maleylpyruvate isomerase family mycothiol-dependent enzyme n=1 Tax=Winogradskya humida TaxID=113566 RepID=A0ABQ3ZFF2_9ACTN|nr:maleylpyruvate isomerase family mycothiol-dependent enzyme [Actinoplanes humidus]GIE17249.1 hypothetical protein Ahu01nite_003510 [Actinoplanes humidus]
MTGIPPYPELLDLINERATAFREAATAADLDTQVPGCPDWTVRDLITHLGAVHRFWATVIDAGPADTPPTPEALGDREPHGDLIEWSAASAALLLEALRAAPADRGCWTWWEPSGAPMTAAAVARHQVHETAIHTYDAQESSGKPQPLPASIAVDGIPEFVEVTLASQGTWPYRPTRLQLSATEGPSWLFDLSSTAITLAPAPSGEPVATLHAPVSDLLLFLYGRIPETALTITGDQSAVTELRAYS